MKKVLFPVLLIFLLCHLLPAQEMLNVNPSTSTLQKFELLIIEIEVDASFSDPYDPQEIAIDMLMTTPSGEDQSLPCFWNESKEGHIWEARFAPQEEGVYSYFIQYNHNGGVEASGAFSLEVIGSNGDGFLHPYDNYSFVFDSGKKFRGIGENFAWEQRPPFDDDENLKYDIIFSRFEENEMNYTRTWMCPWNLPLEWNEVAYYGDYENDFDNTYNHSAIDRFEFMIAEAAEHDVYIQLVLDYHGAFRTEPDIWGGNNFWTTHPYNVDNGGTANSPTAFFTDDEAKRLYRNRLRYLVARWGHSPYIANWEFFNEIDNAMTDENIPQFAIVTWHEEMAAYLDLIDIYDRPISTSLSHLEIPGLFQIPEIDFTQTHLYGLTNQFPDRVASKIAQFNKPYVISEFAYSYMNPAPNEQSLYVTDLRKGIWSGMHLPTPVAPLTWWWENYEAWNLYTPFRIAGEYLQFMMHEEGDFSEASINSLTDPSIMDVYGLMKNGDVFLFANNTSNMNVIDGTIEVSQLEEGAYNITFFNTITGSETSISEIANNQGVLEFQLPYIGPKGDVGVIVHKEELPPLTTRDHKILEINFFPNPVKNVLQIQFETTEAFLTISDLSGRRLKALVINSNPVVDVSGLIPGLYILEIRNQEGIWSEKFVKQ